MPGRRLVLIALLLLVPISAVSALPAQAGSVTMEVAASFAGHFKYGEWLPLRISLANDGPDLYAEVRAESTAAGAQTTYAAAVELPAGARKSLNLYVRPTSFAKAMRVRLVQVAAPGSKGEEEGRELASQTVGLTVEQNVNYLVGIIAARPQAFTILGGLTLNDQTEGQFIKGPTQYERPVKPIPISLADLPERAEGLRALDALVISGVDTSALSPEQGQALHGWVEQGGRLILGGGAAAARALAGLPDSLVQTIRPGGEIVDLASLSALGGFAGEEVRTPGPYSVAWPSGGQALIEQDGRALLAEARLGEGRVSYAALDLAASPFDAWAGAAAFWLKLLTPGSAYPSGAPPDASPQAMRANSMMYPLQNLPALALPSIGWLAGLLAAYVLLVGPLNYLALRRMRRHGWGWVTIPALTLLFSAGAFLFAYRVRGGDVIINKISVIIFESGTRHTAETYVGIFSPSRRAYTLTFPGQSLIAPLSNEGSPWGPGGATTGVGTTIAEGEPAQVRGVQVEQWAMRGFQVEAPTPEGWAIESDLTVEGDRIHGTIANRTSEALVDAVLVHGNRYLQLDDLSAGESMTVDQKLPEPSSTQPFPGSLFERAQMEAGPRGLPRDVQVQQQILGNYFQGPNGPELPGQSIFIGWMRSSPLDVRVAGANWATQQSSLVVAPLSLRYAPGAVHLAPGDLAANLTRLEGEVGNCGPANQVFVVNGQVLLEYQVPAALAGMKVTRLSLVMEGGGGGGDMPVIEMADREGAWVKIDSPRMGPNDLADPARFVGADGSLRLRLTMDGESSRGVMCLGYYLDIEGEL